MDLWDFTSKKDDTALLLELRNDNNSAFNEIYKRYWERMVEYAFRITHAEEEAADIVQEIFVSLWNRRAVLEIKGSLLSYLLKSTRNLSLRYLEKNIGKTNFLERFSLYMKDASNQPIDRVSFHQLQAQVDRTVKRLPKKMKEIYLLSREEQLNHREIATKLGISENTVKKQISNALKILTIALPAKDSLYILLLLLSTAV